MGLVTRRLRSREVMLPKDRIQGDKIKAFMRNGVLTLTVPKVPGEAHQAQAKDIPIEVGE